MPGNNRKENFTLKKIINKKLYDTSTATCIAEYSNPVSVSDFSFYRETLYRKRTGEYFIHGEGGALSRYASRDYDGMTWGEDILPLTYDTARDWAEHHMDVDAYQDEFGPAAEDDSRTVMSLSVRADTADMVRRAAGAAGCSISEYVERALRAQLGGDTDA